jgi:endonuclease YncB( thermonuclease family)
MNAARAAAPTRSPWHLHWLLLALAVALATATLPAHALSSPLQGRVIAVADGDSVTVLDAQQGRHRVRLLGIDAPEQAQPWGAESGIYLRAKVLQQEVQVVFAKTDRHGRLIGTLLLQGQDVNLQMLRAGLAWHYKAYAIEQGWLERWRYARAERQAQRTQRGLWADPAPTPPWEFRPQQRVKR